MFSKAKEVGQNLLTIEINKALFYLAVPMAVSILANMSFNLVDTYFIGQLGIDQLTAISFSFPVVFVAFNLAIGYGIGLSSVLSRLVGANDDENFKNVSSVGIILSLILALIVVLIGVSTITPLFRLLGAGKEHLPYIEEYMFYAYMAMGFRFLSVSLSALFRAKGNTLIPSVAILSTSILNFIFDPILIFGFAFIPALGIKGAGIATLIANCLAFFIELTFAIKDQYLNLSLNRMPKEKIKEVFRIAIPASFSNSLNPLSVSFMNYLLTAFGTSLVAGFGVGVKIQFFILIPILALSAAVSPIVGQASGAKNQARIDDTLKASLRFCFIWILLISIPIFFLKEWIVMQFIPEMDDFDFTNLFLSIIPISLIGYSAVIINSAALNALGKAKTTLLVISLRTFILFTPLAFLLKEFYQADGILYALALTNFLLYIICKQLEMKAQ